jgi:hypothetical protein
MATKPTLIERIYGTCDATWEAWRIDQLRAAMRRAERSRVKTGLLHAMCARQRTPSPDNCLGGISGVLDPQEDKMRDA